MSESEKLAIENISENLEEKIESCVLNYDPFHTETPTHLKTKIYHVGDGNIIGESIIQEFYDYTGVMPLDKGSILQNTNCYADAIHGCG